MAIDLFCYSASSKEEINEQLFLLKESRGDLFKNSFLISQASDATGLQRETASEYGFNPKSFFLVSLNDKNLAHKTSDVSQILKTRVGEKNLLVIWENERPI